MYSRILLGIGLVLLLSTILVIVFAKLYPDLLIDYLFEKKNIHDPSAGSLLSCDINHDALCDINDVAIIYESMGSCRGDERYREMFDIDQDGCLSEEDDLQEVLRQYYAILDYSKVPTPVVTPYDSSCDSNNDFVCDARDIKWKQDLAAEKSAIESITYSLDQYRRDAERYPHSLDDMVPNFFPHVPVLNGLRYHQTSGGLHYELCYMPISTQPPQEMCIGK